MIWFQSCKPWQSLESNEIGYFKEMKCPGCQLLPRKAFPYMWYSWQCPQQCHVAIGAGDLYYKGYGYSHYPSQMLQKYSLNKRHGIFGTIHIPKELNILQRLNEQANLKGFGLWRFMLDEESRKLRQ